MSQLTQLFTLLVFTASAALAVKAASAEIDAASSNPKGQNSTADSSQPSDPAEFFKLGRISRELGDYSLSAAYYHSYLETKPDKKISAKVTSELTACRLLAKGWSLPPKPVDDLKISQARATLLFTQPDVAATRLDELVKACPGRWEAYALRAQNEYRQSRYSQALDDLQIARKKGGMPATLSTAALHEETTRRLHILEVAQKAQNLLAKKQTSSAAKLLETSWKADPSLVEFGIKAAQIHAAAKEFQTAGSMAASISQYLTQHPEHPQAANVKLIEMVAANCETASKTAEKLRSQKLASATSDKSSSSTGKSTNNKPTSKSSGSGESMSSKFMRLKKK